MILKNKSKVFYFGIIIILLFTLIAIFAPYISPYSPHEQFQSYLKPNKEHLLGTNDLGNDILSELIFGTRVSLTIGFFTAFIVTFVGVLVGLISGYKGGHIESFIISITNVAMALPSLPLAMLFTAFMKPGIFNIILAISITGWTSTCRIIRSKTKEISELPFIKIEKTLGISDYKIMFKHIIPNLLDLILIRSALAVGSAMISESTLSFLGLGQFGERSWGSILRYAFFRNSIIKNQVWWYIPPILCITIVVLAFMLIGYYGGKNAE